MPALASPTRTRARATTIWVLGSPVLSSFFSSGTAALALGSIGPGAKAAVPELKKLLKTGDPNTQIVVALALVRVGEAKAGMPTLLEYLRNPVAFVVIEIYVEAQVQLGPADKEVVPVFLEALKDKTVAVRWWAAGALGQIG